MGAMSNSTDLLTVLYPRVDEIRIRDTAGGAGNVVTTATYWINDVDEFYAAAYNATMGYMMDVEVDWTISPISGVGTVTTPGIWTNFTALQVAVDSTCTVTATYSPTVSSSTGLLTVLYPRIDYVQIRSEDNGLGIDLSDPANYPSYERGTITTFYGAAYNNTAGYISSVDVTSAWATNASAIADVSPTGSSTTVTCSPTNSGLVNITLVDGSLTTWTHVTVLPWKVDFIIIRDQPGGGGLNLSDPANYTSYPVGKIVTFYGAAYNHTGGYLGDVDVGSTWQSSTPSIVDVSTPGSSSTITCSDTNSGMVTITLNDGLGHITTTEVTVLDPEINTIVIRDAADGLGNEVTTAIYWAMGTDQFYAAAYNDTAGYLGDVEVVWTISPPSGVGTVTTPGIWTNFTAEIVSVDSTCTVTATYSPTISDTTGLLTVLYPRVDSIIIRDAANDGGSEVTTDTYWANEMDDFYAAAYNASIGYIGEVEAVWDSDDTGVGQVDTLGLMTNFTAQIVAFDSQCTVTATYMGFSDSTGLLTVLYPRVDYVGIRTAAGGGGIELCDPGNYPTYQKNTIRTFYGAEYNASIGYLGPVAASSTWVSNDTAIVDVSSPGEQSTITVSPTNHGWVWVDIDDQSGHTNRTMVTVLEWVIDYVQIRSATGGGGVDLGDPGNYMTYPVGEVVTFHGAAYNNTQGYVGPADVGSSWVSSIPSIVDASTPGSSSTITCDNINWGGPVTITLNDGLGHINTTQVTVLEPTIDTIMIMDAAGGLGSEVTTATYIVNDFEVFYAAAYNGTAGYLRDVDVNWESDATTVGDVSPTTGSDSTTFTAQWVTVDSTCTITATYSVTIGDTTGLLTVLAPTPDIIEIRDAPGRGGNIVDTATFYIDNTTVFYAAGINNIVGYIGDVSVDWTISPISGVGTVGAVPGDSTTFTAVGAGTCIVTATYSPSPTVNNETGLLTVVEDTGPGIDHILIRDASGGAGNVVTTMTYGVHYDMDEFYAAAYDSGNNYLMDVEVDWTISPTSGVGTVTTLGLWTNFTALQVTSISTCTVTATYTPSIDYTTGTLTVLAPTVDEIRIVDTSNTGMTVIVDQEVIVAFTITGYAAAFNDSIGYFDDVDAIWRVVNTFGATAFTDPTTAGTSSEFDAELTGGTATWTADYNGIIGTVVFTIKPPKVDTIIIRDAPNDGGIEVDTANYLAGNTDAFYAAAYNDTTDYLYDVEVTWESDDTTVGQVDRLGLMTNFTAQSIAVTSTCTVTATYLPGITDSTGLLTVLLTVERPDPPLNLRLKVKGPDEIEATWDLNTEDNIAGYIVYRRESPNDPWVPVGVIQDPSQDSFTDKSVEPDTKYYYAVSAVDAEGDESDYSVEASATTEAEDEFPWIWLLLFLIIVIVVLLLVFILYKKRRKEEETPPPVVAPPAAAPAAAPPEEEPMEEEYEEEAPGEEEYEEYEEEAPVEEEYEEEAPVEEEYEEYEEEPAEEEPVEEEYEDEPEEPAAPPTPPPPPPPPPPA
jgi:hypothetical protein